MEADSEGKLKQNRVLRREAGEEWRIEGIDPQLLKLLVEREVAVAKLDPENMAGYEKLHSDEMENYQYIAAQVDEYKKEQGISDPPPLPPEED